MGKDKKNPGKPGKKDKKAKEFPTVAPPAADEAATADEPTTTEDTSTIKPKRRAKIETLELGVAHDLPHLEHLYRLKHLLDVTRGDGSRRDYENPKKAARKALKEIALYREQGEARMHDDARAEKAAKKAEAAKPVEVEETPEVVKTFDPKLDEATQAAKARVEARRKERYDELVASGVSESDARNRSLMSAESDEFARAAKEREGNEEVEVLICGLEFTMPRRLRPAFLTEVRHLTSEDDDAIIPASGDFGRKAAKKKRAKAQLDAVLEKLLHPEADTTVADDIATVESDDLPAPVDVEMEKLIGSDGDDPREGQDFDWHPEDDERRETAAIEAQLSEAEALAAQVEADALDPNPHNIDDVEVRNGRPYLKVIGEDGEVALKPYSRVTNWIDVLDDKSALVDWKLRTALAGVAALDDLDPDATNLIDLVRAADEEALEAVKKLDKRDRKGKLAPGEYADELAEIERGYKQTVNGIVDRALEQGGAFDKARRGTHLHAVFEEFDNALVAAKGKLTVDEWVDIEEARFDDEWTVNGREVEPVDIVDLKAYREAMDLAGIEVLECERRVVNDEHGTTGTFDRGLRWKPEGGRSMKVLGDLKTGRIDYGAGKIAMQLAEYALGDYYDPATGERSRTGYSKSKALLIHSPAGEGKTTIYVLDLSEGMRRLKLAVEVKAMRTASTEARAYRGKEPFYQVVVDPGHNGLHLTEGQRKKAQEAAK